MSARKPRSAIVPRAVFAAVVTLTSVPACSSHEPQSPQAQRSAELRPVGGQRPPSPLPVASVAITPRPPPPVATLDPLSMPYRPEDVVDAGPPDLGASASHSKRHVRRVRVVQPPPAVAMMTVAVRPPYYGVAARDWERYGVAAPAD